VQAARNAGFAEKSAHVPREVALVYSKDPEVLLRISELIAKVAEVKAKVATNAFEAALAEIPASLGPKTVAAVATAIRKRHHRLTALQDVGCAAQATRASANELGLEPEMLARLEIRFESLESWGQAQKWSLRRGRVAYRLTPPLLPAPRLSSPLTSSPALRTRARRRQKAALPITSKPAHLRLFYIAANSSHRYTQKRRRGYDIQGFDEAAEYF
jgi:hypothetical protein